MKRRWVCGGTFAFFFWGIIPIAICASKNATPDQLSSVRNKIIKIVAEINKFDKDLSRYNNEYLAKLEKIRKSELELQRWEDRLLQNRTELDNDLKQTRHKLAQIYLQSYNLKGEDEIMQYYIDKKNLNNKIKNVLISIETLKKMSNKIQVWQKEISLIKNEQNEISQIMMDLENQKKEKGQSYLLLVTEQEKKQLAWEQERLERISRPSISVQKNSVDAPSLFKTNLPINFFDSIVKKNKGLHIYFTQDQDLLAPYPGEVVYAGDLSSYGKVIIIDHGQEVRSVILGDFSIKVSKGEKVSGAQILGALKQQFITTKKQVYFEIRKKNKPEFIASWLADDIKKKISL